MLRKFKFCYELIYVNCVFDEVTLYFRSIDEILNFIDSDIFKNNIRYFISCYDYKNHKYIYNLRSGYDD